MNMDLRGKPRYNDLGPHAPKRHAEHVDAGAKWQVQDEDDLYTLLQQQRPVSSTETSYHVKNSQKKETLAPHLLLGLLHIAQGEKLRPEEQKILDTDQQKELQRLWLLWPDTGNDIRSDLNNLEIAYNILKKEKTTIKKRTSKTEQSSTELRSIRKELENLTSELHLPHLDLYSSEIRSLQFHWIIESRRRALHPRYHSDKTELERLQQLIWMHKEIAANNDAAIEKRHETIRATYHQLSHTTINKSIELLNARELPQGTFLKDAKLTFEQWQKIQDRWSRFPVSKTTALQEGDFAHIYEEIVDEENKISTLQKNEELIVDFFVPNKELGLLTGSFESSDGNAEAEIFGLTSDQYSKLKKNWVENKPLPVSKRQEILKDLLMVFILNSSGPDKSFLDAVKNNNVFPHQKEAAIRHAALTKWRKVNQQEKHVREAQEVAKDFLKAIAELKEFNKRFKTESPTKPWDFSLRNNRERLALIELATTGTAILVEGADLQLTPYDINVLQDIQVGLRAISKNGSQESVDLLETMYQRIQEQKLWLLSIGRPIEKQHPWVTSEDMKKDGKSEADIAFELGRRAQELLWTESKTFSSRSKKTWTEEDDLKVHQALEAYKKETDRYGSHDGGLKIDQNTREVKQTTARNADTYNEQSFYMRAHNQFLPQKIDANTKEAQTLFERAAERLKNVFAKRKAQQETLGRGFAETENTENKKTRREKLKTALLKERPPKPIDYSSAAGVPAAHTKTQMLPILEGGAPDLAETKTLQFHKGSVKKAPQSAKTDFDALTHLLKRPGVDTGRQDNLPHI